MKTKLPEWWLNNREFFEMASKFPFIPKKIRRPIATIVAVLDGYLLYKGPLAPLADLGAGKRTRLEDIEVLEN